MATKYVCDRCGKKLTANERDRICTQVRHRKLYSGLAWESVWHDLCPNCNEEFEEWYFEGKGENK